MNRVDEINKDALEYLKKLESDRQSMANGNSAIPMAAANFLVLVSDVMLSMNQDDTFPPVKEVNKHIAKHLLEAIKRVCNNLEQIK